ncbi:MAG TPA: hypothetical protein VFQ54_04990 [Thermomicrobiales bacterium]|nr:hypothetical protein [Thermomicrobiales bacterium]
MPESSSPLPYAERRDRFAADRERIQRRWSLIANVRLLGFAVLAILLWQALFVSGSAVWLVLTAVALVVVVALVIYHARLRRERDHIGRLVTVNGLAIQRAHLDWDDLPLPPESVQARSHAYAYDLNVIGRASLEQRIGTPATQRGWEALRRWLLAPADLDAIGERQVAVSELAVEVDRRQDVEAAAHRPAGTIGDPAPLVDWAEGPAWLRDRAWLLGIAWISPVALVLAIVAQVTGITPWPLWLIPIVVNVAVFQFVGARASELVAKVAPLHQSIEGYGDVFAAIATGEPRAPMLARIRGVLGSGPAGAMTQIRTLVRASSLALPRGSMLYFPFQMAMLWDIHVLASLERWQRVAGPNVRTWIDAAAEWEALAALSVLAYDHPAWTMPDVAPEHDRFAATAMAHPLILPEEAVANPVDVGPRGSLLFVTGSNMSGKSTLLRAVGVNAVLALAGGPVAATSLSLPPVDVWTCMRVEDSLARGVSFFMAELQRLKAVVDAADAARVRPVLYLLDEILQGTNTAERQIASRQVLRHLSRANAIGAVSSHDLALLEGDQLESIARPVHFAETFQRGPTGPDMTFDYTLRQGLATSTNALKLMELLGFDLSEPS